MFEVKSMVKTANQLLNFYNQYGKKWPWRSNIDPYSVWLSEVMLQQTQVQTVNGYYALFLEKFPTAIAMAEASLDDVVKQWEGLGYYLRIKHFYAAIKEVVEKGKGWPENSDQWAALPGVGPYMSNALMVFICGKAGAMVDANIERIALRIMAKEYLVGSAESKKISAQWIEALFANKNTPDDIRQLGHAMMDLGQQVCKTKIPQCITCPIRESCLSYAHDLQLILPKRKKKKKVPLVDVALGVIENQEGRFLVAQRVGNRHLSGLWELPGGKFEDNETPVEALKREIKEETGLDIEVKELLPNVNHAYTHFKIKISTYVCYIIDGKLKILDQRPYRWIALNEIKELAFPVANRKIFKNYVKYRSDRSEKGGNIRA